MADEEGQKTRGNRKADKTESSTQQLKVLILQIQQSLEEHKEDMKKKLSAQNISIKTMEKNLTKKMSDNLELVTVKIEDEVKKLQLYIDQEVGRLTSRLNEMEEHVNALEKRNDEINKFNPDETIVVINLPCEEDENIMVKAGHLIRQGLRCANVKIVRALRLKGNDGKPGLVKIQVESLENKIKLLRSKQNLKNSVDYSRVFIRSSMTHTERNMEANLKLLLKYIPGTQNLQVSRNGRLKILDSSRSHNDGASNRQISALSDTPLSSVPSPWINQRTYPSYPHTPINQGPSIPYSQGPSTPFTQGLSPYQ